MQYGFFIVLLASIATALLRGGQPEKWGARALIVMTIVQFVGVGVFGVRFGQVDWFPFAVDLIGLASFTAIALFARRIWPLWASALQLVSLTAHFFRVVDIHLHPTVYWLMKSAPTFGVCLILLFATALHRRRLKASGRDASWTEWRDRPGGSHSMRTTRRS